jgi:hypothetical protein
VTLHHFEAIAREIRTIETSQAREAAAIAVSGMRDFKTHFTLRLFLKLCHAG